MLKRIKEYLHKFAENFEDLIVPMMKITLLTISSGMMIVGWIGGAVGIWYVIRYIILNI